MQSVRKHVAHCCMPIVSILWSILAKTSAKAQTHVAALNANAPEKALLYALVDIGENKHQGLDASTSRHCQWKQILESEG
jgi:hypothetical protein